MGSPKKSGQLAPEIWWDWKTILSFWEGLFSGGERLNFRSVIEKENHLNQSSIFDFNMLNFRGVIFRVVFYNRQVATAGFT